jgi:hypothetical protein
MSSPWPLPLIFTSWGFRTKGDRWSTPQELADYCAAAGVRTVAVQLGNEPNTGQSNCTTEEAQGLRDLGLHVVVWGTAGVDYLRNELQRLGASDADWMPQVENDTERDLVISQGSAGIRCPGIVSTYGGASTQSDVDALRGAGVEAVLVEIYSHHMTDVDRMLWQGTQYGWRTDELYACLGTYHGEMPDTYVDTSGIGRDFALYLAEPMSSEQFYAWGAFDGGPPPETPQPEPPTPEDEMEPVTDQQARAAIAISAQASMQNYTDAKPRGRVTIAWRTVHPDNSDELWNAAKVTRDVRGLALRDAVQALYDDADLPTPP